MAADGVDLVSPRVVDFEHCFPDESSAKKFRTAVAGTVLEAKIIRPRRKDGRGWEVQCRVRLTPTHAAITQTELRLGDLARRFDGYPDGWGSMSNRDGSPTE
jgi:hypothetical protein